MTQSFSSGNSLQNQQTQLCHTPLHLFFGSQLLPLKLIQLLRTFKGRHFKMSVNKCPCGLWEPSTYVWSFNVLYWELCRKPYSWELDDFMPHKFNTNWQKSKEINFSLQLCQKLNSLLLCQTLIFKSQGSSVLSTSYFLWTSSNDTVEYCNGGLCTMERRY